MVTLRFEVGKQGDLISRLPSGKLVLLDKKAVLPKGFTRHCAWVCEIQEPPGSRVAFARPLWDPWNPPPSAGEQAAKAVVDAPDFPAALRQSGFRYVMSLKWGAAQKVWVYPSPDSNTNACWSGSVVELVRSGLLRLDMSGDVPALRPENGTAARLALWAPPQASPAKFREEEVYEWRKATEEIGTAKQWAEAVAALTPDEQAAVRARIANLKAGQPTPAELGRRQAHADRQAITAQQWAWLELCNSEFGRTYGCKVEVQKVWGTSRDDWREESDEFGRTHRSPKTGSDWWMEDSHGWFRMPDDWDRWDWANGEWPGRQETLTYSGGDLRLLSAYEGPRCGSLPTEWETPQFTAEERAEYLSAWLAEMPATKFGQEVARVRAAFEAEILAAYQIFTNRRASKLAARLAEEVKLAEEEARAAADRAMAAIPAEWYCFGVSPEEIAGRYPQLVIGGGVAPLPGTPGAGSLSLLAVEEMCSGGKRYAFRVNWQRSTGVCPIVDNGAGRKIRLVAAVEPDFCLVADFLKDGEVQGSTAWTAAGPCDAPAAPPSPGKSGSFGTFASLFNR